MIGPRSAFLAAALAAALAFRASAQDDAVPRGGAYLKSRQNGDGSWSAGGKQLIDTVEAAVSLADDPNVLSKAAAFLKAREAAGTDDLARTLTALSLSAEDISAPKGELLLLQNEDGSWGAQEGHRGSPLDTVLAIRALGTLDIPAVAAAIPYLASKRLLSGGWPLQEGGPADLYVTATVVFSLGEFALQTGFSSADLNLSLVHGSAFIASVQAVDGSFGTDDKIVTTAWCALALLRTSQPPSLSAADSYLRTAQLANGSWQDDVYKTALALRTLQGLNAPPAPPPADLRVDSIAFDPPSPVSGAPVFVTVTVANTGSRSAEDVSLVIDRAGAPLGPMLFFTSVPPGTTASATLTSVFPAGTHAITAAVDPLGRVIERNELNNSKSVPLTVAAGNLPDLSIVPADISFSSTMPIAGSSVTVTATVRNLGTNVAKNVTVSFSDGAVRIGPDVVLPTVPGSGQGVAAVTLSLRAGSHSIFVQVDRDALIAEASETNNSASKVITVLASNLPLPDLAVTEFTLSNAAPGAGEAVTLFARVTNVGSRFDGPAVAVRFFDNAGAPLGNDFTLATLEPGASASLSLAASFAPGARKVSVAVDPANLLAEDLESNNIATRFLTASEGPLADLIVDTVSVSKPALDNGEPVTLSARVRNIGTRAATAFVVRFLDESPSGGAPAGADFAVTGLAAGEETLVQAGWIPPVGTHRIFALADAGNTVAEANEGNNLAFGPTLTVSTTPFVSPSVFEETGKDFWIVIPFSSEAPGLVLLADQAAMFTVDGAFTASGSVGPGAPAILRPPDSTKVAALQTVAANKGIHIVSTASIKVIQLFRNSVDPMMQVREASLALPTPSLGMDYLIAGFGGPNFASGSNSILILATENATDVSIQEVGPAVPQILTSTLNRGEAFRVARFVDLTGSRVTSTKPVVCLFYSQDSTGFQVGDESSTPLLEQLLPAALFGRRFLVPPQTGDGDNPHIRVVAHENDTQVTFREATRPLQTVLLQAQHSTTLFTDRFTEIESTKPVLVAHYDMHNADGPTLTQIVPVQAAKTRYRLHGFVQGTFPYASYAAFVAPSDRTEILRDGASSLLGNRLETASGHIRFGYDVLVSATELGAGQPLEHVIEASRPIVLQSVGLGVPNSGYYAHVGGYRFRTTADILPASIDPPSAVFADEAATVKARIRNSSTANATSVRARLFEGDPAAGAAQIDADVVISALAADQETEITFTWTPRVPGDRTLSLVVDPRNEIAEADEANNLLSQVVPVRAPLDIRGLLGVSGTQFMSNQDVPISASVENLSANPIRGMLKDARLDVLIEDDQGRRVATVGVASLPELGSVPPGLEGWTFYVEASMSPTISRPGPSFVAVPVDFTKLLRAGGSAGAYDIHSLRVVEVAGDAFLERQAYFNPGAGFNVASAAVGIVEWSLPGPLVQNQPRGFRIYFDALEAGAKPIIPRLEEPAFLSGGPVFLTTTPSGAYVLSNREGLFSSRLKTTPANQFFSGFRTVQNVTLADFSGDGFYDVFRSGGSGSRFRLSRAFHLMTSEGSNDLIRETPTIWTYPATATGLRSRTGDVNGDGLADFVVRTRNERHSATSGLREDFHKVGIYLGGSDGAFMLAQDFTAVGPLSNFIGSHEPELDLADADGDGKADLILTTTNNMVPSQEELRVRVFLGIGDGTFATTPLVSAFALGSVVPAGTSNPQKFTAGDFAGTTPGSPADGRVDLLFPPQTGSGVNGFLARGNGDGTFQLPLQIPMSTALFGLIQNVFYSAFNFDYDRDGNLDVILNTGGISTVRIVFGNGNGTFRSATIDPNTGLSPHTAIAGLKANQVSAIAGTLPRAPGAFRRGFSFDTDGLLPGNYRVRMNVFDAEGRLLFTTTQGFEVVSPLDTGTPSEITQARIVTDRFTYQANETAKITSTAINTAVNATLTNLTLRVTVKSPTDLTLFTEERAVASILPGASTSFDSIFGTGNLPAGGAYLARLEVLQGAAVIAQDTATFNIAPTFRFAGTVALAPSTIVLNQPFSITFTLQNLGNQDLAGGTARFDVIQTSTNDVPATFTSLVSAAPGASTVGSIAATSGGIPVGVHLVTYHLDTGTQSFPIAQATLTVVEPACPYLDLAIFGNDLVDLGGTSQTGTMNPDVTGDVFSNTLIIVRGQAIVTGKATSGGSVIVLGQGQVTGSIVQNAPPLTVPSPANLVTVLSGTNDNLTIGLTANGKNPLTGDAFLLEPNDSITLSGGLYFFSSFTVKGTLLIGSRTIIAVRGPILVTEGARVNDGQSAGRLLLVSDSGESVRFDALSKTSATVVAPEAPIAVDGQVEVQGAVVGKIVTITGQAVVLRDPTVQDYCSILPR